MIGIVIVSHSHPLAEGARDLALQMGQGRVAIAAAGGLDDTTIGTNVERILAAIEAVYDSDGVLVLMDLGSAVMSAEMAVEMLPAEKVARVRLSNAPLVEGAIAATVQAALGAPLDVVDAAARNALDTPKVESSPSIGAPVAPPPGATPGAQRITVTIRNRVGLHARPAAQFVQTASGFQAEVRVRNLTRASTTADAKSIFGVLGLNGRQGDRLEILASGPDAHGVLSTLSGLVESGFGEDNGDETTTTSMATAEPRVEAERLRGTPAAAGIAIGPAYLYRPAAPQITRTAVADPIAEWDRVQRAISVAKAAIAGVTERASRTIGRAEAGIFEAQRLFLEDPAFLSAAQRRIEREYLNAEAAVADTVAEFAARLESMEGDVSQQRATDVRDVGAQVLRALTSRMTSTVPDEVTHPIVLVARDLTPSETAQIDPRRVLALCTAAGGPTSHTAILARSLGIPAVVALGDAVLDLMSGTPLIVDGGTGDVWRSPDTVTQATYRQRQQEASAARARRIAAAQEPAVTRDGRRVPVRANIGDLTAARRARDLGAEGIGLLRTEFLFLGRVTLPTEDEQVAAYTAILDAMAGYSTTIRTLDIGGDKLAPYLVQEHEANPLLGQRAIRLSLTRPEVFKTQLRAILRAAAGHTVKLMFPMIATIDELQQAKALLAEARAELSERCACSVPDVAVGIMVETPAAALTVDRLAPEADFFSLGTNDLLQYTFAADRTNPRVAPLAVPHHPAILRQIDMVVRAAHAAGRVVSVCGEMASDERLIPVLVGLGVDELSVNPAAVPDTKWAIRQIHADDARDVVMQSL